MYRKGSLLLALFLLSSPLLPLFGVVPVAAYGGRDAAWNPNGLQHVAWKPLNPMATATFVGFDRDSYLDEWAYLAALPTSVFSAKGQLYASPLLYWDDPAPDGTPQEEMAMYGYESIKYLMEDWMVYTGGELDRLQLLQMEEGQEQAAAGAYTADSVLSLSSTSPYQLASDLALANWAYSDEAVVALIDLDFPEVPGVVSGNVSGTAPGGEQISYLIEGSKTPDPVSPNRHYFDTPEGYKYIQAIMEWTWSGQTTLPDGSAAGERGKDLDLQLYDSIIGEVVASEYWNVIEGNLERPYEPPYEDCYTYVYNPGEWGAYVTYMPTKGYNAIDSETGMAVSTLLEPPQQDQDSEARYEIDITIYPGVDVVLPTASPAMTGPATFILDWDDGQNLGLIVRGPSGAELARDTSTDRPKTVSFTDLGQGVHSVSVINLDDNAPPAQFDVSYSFEPVMHQDQANALGNAANGAVWASLNNMPLLYTSESGLPDITGETLNELGVDKVYLVDLGNQGERVEEDLKDLRARLQGKIDIDHISKATAMYRTIHDLTGQNDIVFTSLRGWRPWLLEATWTFAEHKEATFLGPAALAAAFHGAPLIISDLHPQVSGPVAWHNSFWQQAYRSRLPPGIAAMYLTGTMVYDFLTENGLNETDKESILTVAGQFTIGQAWDRMFPGVADAGRIFGTPVDTAAWVARSGLYPALIWANPTVDPSLDTHEGRRIMGSVSEFQGGQRVVTSPEREEVAEFNIAQSWVSYQHRFNQRASEHWGAPYTGPAGLTPWFSESDNPIDMDVNANYGRTGQYYPDMTTSEVVPFYAEKGGFDSVFTTRFEQTMENLNRGTLLWVEVMHGGHQSGGDHSGVVGFWEPWDDSLGSQEENPWRGYESTGTTEEFYVDQNSERTMHGPDTITMNKYAGADGERANDLGWAHGEVENHDGVIIAIAQQIQTAGKYGTDFAEALDNVHSMGFNGGSCLIADTYLHLSMVRHGSVFQVIDPWLTSWYCALAIEMFVRGLVLGNTVGEAYSEGIHHVGIEYLTKQWWWDIFENVVYYGDPDLRMWSPQEHLTWSAPPTADLNVELEGHAPGGATDHPHAVGAKWPYQLGLVAMIAIGIAVTIAVVNHFRPDAAEELAGQAESAETAEEVLDAEQ